MSKTLWMGATRGVSAYLDPPPIVRRIDVGDKEFMTSIRNGGTEKSDSVDTRGI